MSDIKPAEVSAILKKQLADVNLDVELEEVGTVLTVGDGIARVYGLNNAQSGELVEFDTGDQGIVQNLEEDNVGVVMLGEVSTVNEGDTVKRVQELLIKLGYLSKGSATGYFGDVTDKAVKEFQKNNGLAADGMVGPLTWAKLSAEYSGAGGIDDMG